MCTTSVTTAASSKCTNATVAAAEFFTCSAAYDATITGAAST